MRLLPNIRYGTEGYSEKVARRLRAVNVTAWLAAAVAAFFAIVGFLGPVLESWKNATLNVVLALCFASIPLLHRFGPLAAPLAFLMITFAFIFIVTFLVGTGGGTYLYFMTATALAILFLGPDRVVLTAAIGVLAAGFTILLHLVVPHDTGLMPPTALFFANFVTNVVASTAILFAVVHYAVRQIARAEATAEREYERSESLLSNILPQRKG